jgi:hypothetical protein
VGSATDDDAFTRRLAQSSLTLTKHTARSHNGKGRLHVFWIRQTAHLTAQQAKSSDH